MNTWYGTWSFFRRESHRFLKVWRQTIGTPLMTAALYFIIFGGALGGRIGTIDGMGYLEFLVPGLAAMGMMQHAFQNTSSSMIQMKMLNMLQTDLLALPLTSFQVVLAFMGSAILRGVVVGGVTLLVSRLFVPFTIQHPLVFIVSALALSGILGLMGLVVGMYGQKFDDVALLGNFLLTPMVYLGGVFFSVSMLPEQWQIIAMGNPIFHLVDLFRYSITGISGTHASHIAVFVVPAALMLFFGVTVVLMERGWRIKN
ncbi:MAG: ABC transporter permease [Magnetococcales bacterium]|nr:ABC transporter permease [Magnetococcales bacterium]